MKRLLKWLAFGVGGIAVLALVALATVYARSQWLISRTWEVPESALQLSEEARQQASVEEGKRLATLLGCFNGCHGRRVQGGVFLDIPNVGKLVAPSLSHLASKASDAELVRSIRFGIKNDGTSVWAMPSQAFYHLSDEQLASIIKFLRSEPVGEPMEEQSEFRILSRVGIALGEFPAPPAITTTMPERLSPARSNAPHAKGRQLAIVACSECHGTDLQGNTRLPSPPLAVVKGYDRDAFRHFMTTGEALGGRKLGLMTEMAIRRFAAMRPEEINALYDYLSQTGGMDLVDERR